MSVSAEQLATEWAADDDVLKSLRANGDQASVERMVDVSFKGSRSDLEALACHMERFGFQIDYWSETDDGEPWLFLDRRQTSERDVIHAMTKCCLEAAARFNAIHDGWGCIAHNEHGPIDNENPA